MTLIVESLEKTIDWQNDRIREANTEIAELVAVLEKIASLKHGPAAALARSALDTMRVLTTAAEVGEPLPSTNWKDGKPYNYCPECGRDDRFLDAATIERCAQVAEHGYGPIGENIAAAIRALKDKP